MDWLVNVNRIHSAAQFVACWVAKGVTWVAQSYKKGHTCHANVHVEVHVCSAFI